MQKKRELQKVVTRFFYPITIQAWFIGSTKELKRIIGVGFDFKAKFDGKKVEFFRLEEELNTTVKKAMLSFVKTQKFLRGIAEYKKLVLKYNRIIAKNISLKQAVTYAIRIYPLFAVGYYVPLLWSKDLPPEKKEKIIDLCTQYRKISEGILNRLDLLINNYCKKRNLSRFITLEILERKQNLSARKIWLEKGYIFSRGKFYNISWNKFLKKNKFFCRKEKINFSNKLLKGNVVFPGIVRGESKIIFSPYDFGKIKKGDILISSMTQPTFGPIFSKIGGIVTDEGGITCHAAIVARELKKPCITATKIATQVLKDGDFVEVDANKGIVKILKRAKR